METFLPIPQYEEYYEISDLGHVRCLQRRRGPLPRNWPYLTPTPSGPQGRKHLNVTLYDKEGGRKSRRTLKVHALVMLAFVGPCPVGMEIRHLNGDYFDNRLENLCYGTHAENMQDAIRHGTFVNVVAQRNAAKTYCPKDHPYDERNTRIARDGSRACRACHKEWQAKRRLLIYQAR